MSLLASTFGNRFSHFDCIFNFISVISISEIYLFFIMVHFIIAVGFFFLQILKASIVSDFLEGKNVAVYYYPMTSLLYSSWVHFWLFVCLISFFLVLVTLLVFTTAVPLLDKSLVWTASCSLFTGDCDPVAYFLTLSWLEIEGHNPCLSLRRAMWHDLFRVDFLILLMAVCFKCYKHQCF